jgi:hypothetical protein
MEVPTEKLPQNIQSLIGEIGEKQVLLRLYLLAHGTAWNVFHNLGEAGFDALLLNSKTGEKVRIEVKTRQKLYTTGKHHDRFNFFLTDGEYQACDFLVAYLLDTNEFFIVSKEDLKRGQANGITRWRFNVRLNQKGVTGPSLAGYRGAWHRLHPDFSAPLQETREVSRTLAEEIPFEEPDTWPDLEEAVLEDDVENSGASTSAAGISSN